MENIPSAANANIDTTINPQFLLADDEKLSAARNEVSGLLAYLKRNVAAITKSSENSSAAFALFHNDGCLVELLGNKKSISALQAAGIHCRTLWTPESLGFNAVSTGLTENQSMASAGNENSHTSLKKYALYFSPLEIKTLAPP